MKITANTAVTLRMKVTDSQGLVYDDGKKPVSYLHGDYDNLFAKLEAALEGQESGFQTTLELATEDTFGERDEALVTTMPKSDFPPGVKVGGQIQRIGGWRAALLLRYQDQRPHGIVGRQPPAVRQSPALCRQSGGCTRGNG